MAIIIMAGNINEIMAMAMASKINGVMANNQWRQWL